MLYEQEEPWYADEGDCVGRWQFALDSVAAAPALPAPMQTEAPRLTETDGTLAIEAGRYRAMLDRETGLLTAVEVDGSACLIGSAAPVLSRGRSGIDPTPTWVRFDDFTESEAWAPGAVSVQTLEGAGQLRVEVTGTLEREGVAQASYRLAYVCDAEGIDVEMGVTTLRQPVILPRVGMGLVLAAGFDQLSYCGYGPGESYVDRLEGTYYGVHHSTVEEQHFPFVPPAENGGHEGTRWLRLARADGAALRVEAATPFHFDAHHNSIADYQAARHEHELIRRPEVYLHIDAAHGPIGGDMAWSTVLAPELTLTGGSYQLRYRLSFEQGED